MTPRRAAVLSAALTLISVLVLAVLGTVSYLVMICWPDGPLCGLR